MHHALFMTSSTRWQDVCKLKSFYGGRIISFVSWIICFSVLFVTLVREKKGTETSDIYANMLPDINMYESQMHSTLEWRICELRVSQPCRAQESLLHILSFMLPVEEISLCEAIQTLTA